MLPFIDLKAQYRMLEPKIRARIDAVLAHGGFIMGPEVAELEAKLAAYCGARHVITCASGTDALLMPLMAWNVGPGDAVFVPTFTFFATAEVVALLGATPVFVEIDPVTFNMDADALELAIKAVAAKDPCIYPLPANYAALKPKAIIPVDLFGIAANYEKILPLAAAHKLLVLEDAAQAFGGQAGANFTGNLNCEAAAFSFFPAKPLGGYGDSGAIATNSDKLAAVLKSIRVHGQGEHKYQNIRLGLNGRMDTLQAAILLPKLEILADEIGARQQVAAGYSELLAGIKDVVAPTVPVGRLSAWAQYSILVPKREEVMAHMQKAGIPTNIYYPASLHQQKVFAHLGYADDCFAVTRDICARILSLPMHPYLNAVDQASVCQALANALKG